MRLPSPSSRTTSAPQRFTESDEERPRQNFLGILDAVVRSASRSSVRDPNVRGHQDFRRVPKWLVCGQSGVFQATDTYKLIRCRHIHMTIVTHL
jgi:hypothetical protein